MLMRAVAVGAVLVAVAAFAQEGKSVTLNLGEKKVLTIPGIMRVAVEDSGVADVKTIGNDQLLVLGTGTGKTQLLVWKQSGEQVSYRVQVKAAPKPKGDAAPVKAGP